MPLITDELKFIRWCSDIDLTAALNTRLDNIMAVYSLYRPFFKKTEEEGAFPPPDNIDAVSDPALKVQLLCQHVISEFEEHLPSEQKKKKTFSREQALGGLMAHVEKHRISKWPAIVRAFVERQLAEEGCLDTLLKNEVTSKMLSTIVQCVDSGEVAIADGLVCASMLVCPFFTPQDAIYSVEYGPGHKLLSEVPSTSCHPILQKFIIALCREYSTLKSSLTSYCEQRYVASADPQPIPGFEIDKVMCIARREERLNNAEGTDDNEGTTSLLALASALHDQLRLWNQQLKTLSFATETLSRFLNKQSIEYTQFVLNYLLDDDITNVAAFKSTASSESDGQYLSRLKVAVNNRNYLSAPASAWMTRFYHESDELWTRRIMCFANDWILEDNVHITIWLSHDNFARFSATETDDEIELRLFETVQTALNASDEAAMEISKHLRGTSRQQVCGVPEDDESWYTRITAMLPESIENARLAVEAFNVRTAAKEEHKDDVEVVPLYIPRSGAPTPALSTACVTPRRLSISDIPLKAVRGINSRLESDETYINYCTECAQSSFVCRAIDVCNEIGCEDAVEMAGLFRAYAKQISTWQIINLIGSSSVKRVSKAVESDDMYSYRLLHDVFGPEAEKEQNSFEEWARRNRGGIALPAESDQTPLFMKPALLLDLVEVDAIRRDINARVSSSLLSSAEAYAEISGVLHKSYQREYPVERDSSINAAVDRYMQWYVRFFMNAVRKGYRDADSTGAIVRRKSGIRLQSSRSVSPDVSPKHLMTGERGSGGSLAGSQGDGGSSGNSGGKSFLDMAIAERQNRRSKEQQKDPSPVVVKAPPVAEEVPLLAVPIEGVVLAESSDDEDEKAPPPPQPCPPVVQQTPRKQKEEPPKKQQEQEQQEQQENPKPAAAPKPTPKKVSKWSSLRSSPGLQDEVKKAKATNKKRSTSLKKKTPPTDVVNTEPKLGSFVTRKLLKLASTYSRAPPVNNTKNNNNKPSAATLERTASTKSVTIITPPVDEVSEKEQVPAPTAPPTPPVEKPVEEIDAESEESENDNDSSSEASTTTNDDGVVDEYISDHDEDNGVEYDDVPTGSSDLKALSEAVSAMLHDKSTRASNRTDRSNNTDNTAPSERSHVSSSTTAIEKPPVARVKPRYLTKAQGGEKVIPCVGYEWVVTPSYKERYTLYQTTDDVRLALAQGHVRMTDLCCRVDPNVGTTKYVPAKALTKMVLEHDACFMDNVEDSGQLGAESTAIRRSLGQTLKQQCGVGVAYYRAPGSTASLELLEGQTYASEMKRLIQEINADAHKTQMILLDMQSSIAAASPQRRDDLNNLNMSPSSPTHRSVFTFSPSRGTSATGAGPDSPYGRHTVNSSCNTVIVGHHTHADPTVIPERGEGNAFVREITSVDVSVCSTATAAVRSQCSLGVMTALERHRLRGGVATPEKEGAVDRPSKLGAAYSSSSLQISKEHETK
eukprot:PhM_4_TR3079/c0_g1_i1/m.102693